MRLRVDDDAAREPRACGGSSSGTMPKQTSANSSPIWSRNQPRPASVHTGASVLGAPGIIAPAKSSSSGVFSGDRA